MSDPEEAPPVDPVHRGTRFPSWMHSLIQDVAASVPRLLFVAVAALFALAGWLRPPLSPDISSLHLSLGLWDGGQVPDALLQGPRRIPTDSAGLLLAGVLASGAVLAVWRPRRFPLVCGVLLSVAIAANAAIALNHPALIERLERERVQRQQVVQVLRYSPGIDPLSTPTNGRIPTESGGRFRDRAWADLERPWDYLLYGVWLIVWAGLGIWFAAPAAPPRRWRHLAGWTAIGVVLGGALCAGRLRAESHWIAAHRAEMRGELSASRDHIRLASRLCPQFTGLQRTSLLLGRLDYLESRSTPAEVIFRAAQLSSVAGPWREGPQERDHAIDRLRRAVSLMEPLLGKEGPDHADARLLAARILTDLGVSLYVRRPRFIDAGIDETEQRRQLIAAQDAWRRAAELDPSRLDQRIYLGYVQTLLDPAHPERAALDLAIADRLLQADVLNVLADAYFAAGRLTDARRRYAESLDLLNLPQRKNFRAQKGLGGL